MSCLIWITAKTINIASIRYANCASLAPLILMIMMMSKYFLVSEPENGDTSRCLAIADKLQAIIDHIKTIQYMPYSQLKIYSSHDMPLSVNYVDGKLFFQ